MMEKGCLNPLTALVVLIFLGPLRNERHLRPGFLDESCNSRCIICARRRGACRRLASNMCRSPTSQEEKHRERGAAQSERAPAPGAGEALQAEASHIVASEEQFDLGSAPAVLLAVKLKRGLTQEWGAAFQTTSTSTEEFVIREEHIARSGRI